MASRDSQTVLLSRQAILLVTAMGVGLLTLCYVLGVQVGKQSAALRHSAAKDAGEELEELPATMADQLKALEQSGSGTGFEKAQKPPAAKPEDKGGPQPEATPEEKPAAAEPPKKAAAAEFWTLQLVSTPDAAEAKTVAGRAKAAGFATETITEKGLRKVRVVGTMKREAADAALVRLKKHGFKPFVVKVDG